ncbi:hypothetical protein BDD12DRAFT_872385 [Trichophaea hybrida]|nr:hypothetical protein BDD12DRAFT_872385 [Trichophaea hybrida]
MTTSNGKENHADGMRPGGTNQEEYITVPHLSRTPKLNLAPLPPNSSPPLLPFITINFLRKLITIKPQPTITKMPQSYIFTFKEGADKDKFKKELAEAGGKVTHEYSLIPALSAELPDGYVGTLGTHDSIKTCEPDGKVTTQKK